MRSLAHRLWPAGSGSTVSFRRSCGQACTRAPARLDRDRTAALRLGPPH